MNNTEKSASQKGADKTGKFVEEVFNEAVVIFGMGISHFARLLFQKPRKAIPLTAVLYGAMIFAVIKGLHLRLLVGMAPELVGTRFLAWIYHQSVRSHVYVLTGFLTALISIILGTKLRFTRTKYQKIFKSIGLTNGLQDSPVLVDRKKLDPKRIKLTFDARNIGITRFEAATGDLEAAFGKSIESIEHENSQRFISLVVTEKRLPTHVTFEEVCIKNILNPYSFYVGWAREGIIQQSICDLPHMLIAGTTGAGKSCFFKQTLVGLLQSSPHLQMYLIDLKSGLEMVDFEGTPNVQVIKTMAEAVYILRKMKAEMQARFSYLEKKKLKFIDPKRDHRERIIVAVDEASVLYMKRAKDDPEFSLSVQAQKITDDLAKLSRAAAIHLIFATQKVSKEIIATSIQENISARMCFKMNTLQGSLIVLGNKDAAELPDTKGRGIWSLGNKFTIAQAPYISDVAIVERCSRIKAEFIKGVRKSYSPMINIPAHFEAAASDLENVTASIEQPSEKDTTDESSGATASRTVESEEVEG